MQRNIVEFVVLLGPLYPLCPRYPLWPVNSFIVLSSLMIEQVGALLFPSRLWGEDASLVMGSGSMP